jgi:hypothetical protein
MNDALRFRWVNKVKPYSYLGLLCIFPRDCEINQQKFFLTQQLAWIAVCFAVSLAVSAAVALGTIMIVFLAVLYAVKAWAVRIRGMHLSPFPNNLPFSIQNPQALEFHCMVCGTSHKNRECPKCGSRAVRAG